MKAEDFQIHDHDKLDRILTKLCEMVIRGQQQDPDLGMVAAAVLDPDNRCVAGINYPSETGHRVHAERAAIDAYTQQFGAVPRGSIVITTLSPCSEHMDERDGTPCTDLLHDHGIHKVYCGYKDPTQRDSHKRFHTEATRNPKLHELCHQFAATFLEPTQQLDELSFLGSPCTKDCSGHRAGYRWSKDRGKVHAASWSDSFNRGAALAAAGR
jgi:pyrimidine deaminase RibD-like protein